MNVHFDREGGGDWPFFGGNIPDVAFEPILTLLWSERGFLNLQTGLEKRK